MKYMLDTNICIYLIKQHPTSVVERFKSITKDEVILSAITQAELEYGVKKSQHFKKNQAALEKFLLPFDIKPFDDIAAITYGEIRAYLEKKGLTIGSLDMLISAHARSLNAILVTNNTKEFVRIPGLQVENWV